MLNGRTDGTIKIKSNHFIWSFLKRNITFFGYLKELYFSMILESKTFMIRRVKRIQISNRGVFRWTAMEARTVVLQA